MSFFSVSNVQIAGLSACVPAMKDDILSVYSKWGDAETFITSTGIESRRRVSKEICTSDLGVAAAGQLLKDLNWDKDTVDAVIFVTQTPDYILPATSCTIQDRLGLSKDCYTLDISLGCSGWVYGMSVISSLLASGSMKRGLLIAGDTCTRVCADTDKSTWPLFGDAATATALEYQSDASSFDFSFNTDGSGYDAIIIPEGAQRNTFNNKSLEKREFGENIVGTNITVRLNGMDVFAFGISKAPASVNGLISHFGIDKDSVDYFYFHQANMLMNEKIRKKLKLPQEKVPYSLKDFANTSSASIPLTMITQKRNQLMNESLSNIACGFGVGLSWGSLFFKTNKIVVSNLIEI